MQGQQEKSSVAALVEAIYAEKFRKLGEMEGRRPRMPGSAEGFNGRVTQRQIGIMRLADRPVSVNGALAAQIGLMPHDLNHVVSSLLTRGFVRQERTSRAARTICITDAGRAALEQADDA